MKLREGEELSHSFAGPAVSVAIVLICQAACDPHHLLKALPQDAAATGGSPGFGGAPGLGGASGLGGQGTGGALGSGGFGTGGASGLGGQVARDASATEVAADGGLRSGSITVTALIDGEDLLHILPTGIYWEHVTRAGPGMHNFQTLPTTITSDTAGNVSWCPQWDNGCNTCDGSCGELRASGKSAVLPLDVIPGTIVSATFACSGRNSCRLVQAPTSEVPEAIVDMDDVSPGGPDTYSATLSFTYLPGPKSG